MAIMNRRNIEIATAVLNGQSYRAVARSYKLTRDRPRQITFALCWQASPQLYAGYIGPEPRIIYLRNYAGAFIKSFKIEKYIYCKYCGAKLKRDHIGQYCPTENCDWHQGLEDEDEDVCA